MKITRDDLAAMFPRALPEWLEAMYELCPVLGAHYGFNRLDWVHFCGQIAAETNGLSLRNMQENMSFSTSKRILEVYSYRLGVALKREKALRDQYRTREALAKALVRNPKELADLVYGGREGTPWREGSKYIGRGPTQITHLNNYRAIGEEISRQPGGDAFDLVKNPEMLATDPELGVRSAFADWHLKGLSRWAQKDDCDTLSDALNTGNIRDNVKPHGLPRRRLETKRAKKIWPKHFTFQAVDFDPVPEPVPVPVPPKAPVPKDIKDMVRVSRKARWLLKLKAVFHSIWATFSGAALLDWFGFAQEVFDEVKTFVTDHALAVAICVALLGAVVVRHVLSLMVEDAVDGRYVPSGMAEEGVGPDPHAVDVGQMALFQDQDAGPAGVGVAQGRAAVDRADDPSSGRVAVVRSGPLPGPN